MTHFRIDSKVAFAAFFLSLANFAYAEPINVNLVTTVG